MPPGASPAKWLSKSRRKSPHKPTYGTNIFASPSSTSRPVHLRFSAGDDDVDAWVEWLISSGDDHNAALNETVSLTVHGAAQTTHYDMVEVPSIEATLHSVPVRAAKLDGGRFESTTFRCADDLWGRSAGKAMIEGEHLNVYVETRQVNVIIVDGQGGLIPRR